MNNTETILESTDYIQSQVTNPMLSLNTNVQISSRKTTMSFANAVKSPTIFPTKKQAIVLAATEGIQIKDYIMGVGTIIGGQNILFASRISKNRICLYLKSEKNVDDLIANHQHIQIQGIDIPVRRLITLTTRLILSNVSPCIPHTLVEKTLEENNIKTVSPVTFLKAGIAENGYSHIYSFRRQVFILPTDNNSQVPESLLINYESEEYRIFISGDEMKCFTCKAAGHVSYNCPSKAVSNMIIDDKFDNNKNPTKRPAPTTPDELTTAQLEHTTDRNIPDHEEQITLTQIEKTPINNAPETNFLKPTAHTPKKHKAELPSENKNTSVDELLEPAKAFIESNSFVMNYNSFVDFIQNAQGSPDLLSCVQQYTNDIPINMLTRIYPRLTDRRIKTRCTKIRNKIFEHPKLITSHETDSDSSIETH